MATARQRYAERQQARQAAGDPAPSAAPSATPAAAAPQASPVVSRVGVGTRGAPTTAAPAGAATTAATSPLSPTAASAASALGTRRGTGTALQNPTAGAANPTPAVTSPTASGTPGARIGARVGLRTEAAATAAAPAAADPTASAESTPGTRLAARRAGLATGSVSAGSTEGGAPTRSLSHSRRPSKVVVEREKKTEYWRDVAEVAAKEGTQLQGEDLNNVITRAMTLGIVGDKKQRESLSGPKAQELLVNMKDEMEKRLVEMSGGKINLDALVSQNASLMDKILGLEKTLSALEKKKAQAEEEERQKVQSKIQELETSLRQLEHQKKEQREQNRRTMKLEIANLKEMMSKVQKEQANEQAAAQETKQMSQKMARLEAALRLMNEERKKGQGGDDKETLLLKKKLALFEQKLKDIEEEKKMQNNEEENTQLRDKLLIMEDKLEKMERRKSMSMTMMLQQKMDGVEKQLSILRTKTGGPDSDAVQTRMIELEKQLLELSKSKASVNPTMINDEETVALRNHVKKLEGSVLMAEKKMEDQRKKIEEERLQAIERRKREEEEFRKQQKLREEELLKRIRLMEDRMQSGGVAGAGADPALLERLKKLESGGGNSDLAAKMSEMEAKLKETQSKLENERKLTQDILNIAPKEPPAMEAWQKDAQIRFLQQMNEQLMQKINDSTKLMDEKMAQMKNMQISGGAAAVPKSGLSYEEINKKLAELQTQLFDENTDDREREKLNIEYEKLITELEQTPEYKKEQEDAKERWKTENTPLNKDAFDRVAAELRAKSDQQQQQIFQKKPELKLLLRTPDSLMKAHINDFKTLSTQNLDEDEARALYHNMPKFRPDQEKQCEWVEQLRNKIEQEKGKPKKKPPPPIQATKKIVIKKTEPEEDDGGGGGGFLEELLKKRKKRD